MNNDRIVVLDGARTPIGSFGGMFKDVPAFELGATAAVEALSRAKVDPADIREVVMGCIGQVGPDAYNARRVAVRAGLSTSVPAYTVNRLCGSGLQAVWSAAMEMRWNDLDFVLAGGDESMTRMPFYDFGGRSGYKLGNRALVDGTVMMLTDPFHDIHMGVTAENVAKRTASPAWSRTSSPPSRSVERPHPRLAPPSRTRSWQSRSAADARSPRTPTSIRSRAPQSRPWRACAPRSRRTAR